MDQSEKAKEFAALHVKGAPLVLYNIWDAGGGAAMVKAGALAVATGSYSVASAHGFRDGEAIPLPLVLDIVARIAATVECPVTVDFEGGYAAAPEDVARNVAQIIEAGAIGINFEDRVVQGAGLYAIDTQVARIRAVRAAADEAGVPLFINARTDVFLSTKADTHESHMADAITRAAAYQEAGANGFFVPGLTAPALISQVTQATTLPVNVMMMGDNTSLSDIAALGVARASYGPQPYFDAMADLTARFKGLT